MSLPGAARRRLRLAELNIVDGGGNGAVKLRARKCLRF